MRTRRTLAEFKEGILAGDRVLLAQAITLVESGLSADQELATALIQELLPQLVAIQACFSRTAFRSIQPQRARMTLCCEWQASSTCRPQAYGRFSPKVTMARGCGLVLHALLITILGKE